MTKKFVITNELVATTFCLGFLSYLWRQLSLLAATLSSLIVLYLLSHTLIVLIVVSSSFHTIFCSSLYSHCGKTFFLFLHFTTWIKATQFFLDLCTLQKLYREDPNLVVSLLGVLSEQKSHFSLLVSCRILLFFFSSHTIKFFATLSIYKTSNQIPWYTRNVLLLW